MIEPSFRTILTEAQPVHDLVTDRIYFGAGSQDERRARIVITLTSRENPHCFDGPAGYFTAVLNVACLAPTYPGRKALADAARTALDSFEGTVTSGDVAISIDLIEVSDEQDIPAAPLDGQALPTFGVGLDCNVMWKDVQ